MLTKVRNEFKITLMRRLLDAFITAVVLLLFIPTFLILLSWNAIPGDSLYPLKTGLEDITLLLLSGTPLVPKVSMKFTDRRFDEATKLLNQKGSTVGYDLLVSEAQQTQTLITSKNDRIDTATFVQNIDQYQQKIEQTKVQVQVKSGISVSQQTPSIMPTQVPVPLQTPPSATSQPVGQEIIVTKPETVVIKEETPQQVLQKLNDTEAQLEEIKKQVQKNELQGGNSDQGQGLDKNQDHGNQNSSDHKSSSNNP